MSTADFPAPETIKPFTKLPTRTRSKIKIDGPEREVCWHWTGSFTEPATHHKAYAPTDDKVCRTWGCKRNMRGVSKVRIPGKKGPVPAHRAVFACLTDTPYDETPKLSRCVNDRCVSPYHALPADLSPYDIRRRAAGLLNAVPAPGSVTPEQVRGILRRVRPFSGGGTVGAEEECDLPAGSITPEIWREYVLWDETNPEPDDV